MTGEEYGLLWTLIVVGHTALILGILDRPVRRRLKGFLSEHNYQPVPGADTSGAEGEAPWRQIQQGVAGSGPGTGRHRRPAEQSRAGSGRHRRP